MLILIDKKIPLAAKQKLAAYGEIVEFATEGITYDAISGHPDIFFCPTPAGLLVAPNLPGDYFAILKQYSIPYTTGQKPVGRSYPETAPYNSLVSEKCLIQNKEIADPEIKNMNPGSEVIHVRQGYVRCNLVSLPGNLFITSDRGIEKSLLHHQLETLYVDPSCVKLDGFEHGFFGGACGLLEDTLFICGSLNSVMEKESIEAFCCRAGVQIIELYDGQPFDVGTLIFLIPETLKL
ncbi:MAG: DUF6873 family GME fold protein [Bacteroidota bacterium]